MLSSSLLSGKLKRMCHLLNKKHWHKRPKGTKRIIKMFQRGAVEKLKKKENICI
jgi:hypothetical protein